MTSRKLDITEYSDFHYLLSLMPVLDNEPGFAWLPELFSIIGHEKLIELSKYAGGELIRIPTIEELTDDINALDWFYKVRIAKTHNGHNVPTAYREKFNLIESHFKKVK